MLYHDILWYTMVYHGIPWYTMVYHEPGMKLVYHGKICCTMIYCGIPWYTMVYHSFFGISNLRNIELSPLSHANGHRLGDISNDFVYFCSSAMEDRLASGVLVGVHLAVLPFLYEAFLQTECLLLTYIILVLLLCT